MRRQTITCIILLLLFVLLPALALADGTIYQSIMAKAPANDANNTTDAAAANAELINAAKHLYLDQVVPTLLEDKVNMLNEKTTDTMMKSATILGPVPVFARQGVKDVADPASLISDVIYTKTWAFIAISGDQPLAVFHLGFHREAYFLSEYTGSKQAEQCMECCRTLGKTDWKDMLLLRIQNDELFVGSDDRIMLKASANNPSAKAYTFSALAKAVAQQDQYNREHPNQIGGSSLADFLEGNVATAASSNARKSGPAAMYLLIGMAVGLVVGAAATALVFTLARRKRSV